MNYYESIAHYCLWGLEGLMQTDNVLNNINYFQNFDLENGDDQMNLGGLGSKYDFYTANKEEMYLRLLTGYKYETVTFYDVSKEKEITEYKWGYEDCGKLLQKPWNLLDHVRMHEGVKPYICQWWGKGFTQKGNLKKHARQHINPDVNERKRYNCRFWGKGYTERYNLKVNKLLLMSDDLRWYFIFMSCLTSHNFKLVKTYIWFLKYHIK